MTLQMIKLQSELHRVKSALLESQARIIERELEIQTIRETIVLQEKHEDELTKKLDSLKGQADGN